MPTSHITAESLADIVCTPGADFQVKLDAGTIALGPIFAPNHATATWIDGQTIEVSGLPAGKSYLTFGYVADPGGADANISVGTITSGDAATNPGHVVNSSDAAPAIVIYGKAKPW